MLNSNNKLCTIVDILNRNFYLRHNSPRPLLQLVNKMRNENIIQSKTIKSAMNFAQTLCMINFVPQERGSDLTQHTEIADSLWNYHREVRRKSTESVEIVHVFRTLRNVRHMKNFRNFIFLYIIASPDEDDLIQYTQQQSSPPLIFRRCSACCGGNRMWCF